VYLLPGEQIRPDAARLLRSRPGFLGSADATEEGMPGVAYRWMEVEGPIATAAERQTALRMVGDPDGDPEQLLREFMVRAYRRPPRNEEVQRYVKIVRARLADTRSSFVDAMISGYTAVLSSPGFLYLEERPGRLDSYALASRLSYVLWNGPPDRELRALAAKGALGRPAVRRSQVNRLLDDARSREFVDAFLDYWLDLRKTSETAPDQTLYPDYYLDDLLTESAVNETRLFFHHLVRQNLPVRNIIDSDFAMLNSRLAHHYGLPPVG
jgi:hypothetical protein